MGKKVPRSIKLQVLDDWMAGISRDDTAMKNGISTGSVSNSIRGFQRRDITDVDLLRSTSVYLKSQNLDLNDMSSSIRLKNMLDRLELPAERLDRFLQALSIYNYKNDIEDPGKFIYEVKKISDYLVHLNVSVYEIIDYIEKKKLEFQKIENDILGAKMDLGMIKYQQRELLLNNEKSKTSNTFGDDVNNPSY